MRMVTVSPLCCLNRMRNPRVRLSIGTVLVMRSPLPAILLMSLAGCVDPISATPRFEPEISRLTKEDYAQCRAQCRAEGATEADCTINDSTNGLSCPSQRLACLARCRPPDPAAQQTPILQTADRNL